MTPHARFVEGTTRGFWALPQVDGVGVAWLGQAGFALRGGGVRMVIDPYLSNALEEKYADPKYSRRTPPVIDAAELTGTRLVLCTHRHTDHLDAATLREITRIAPHCQVVIPRAELGYARSRDIGAAQWIGMDAGEVASLAGGVTVTALPSAHEELETDAHGCYRYLGYLIQFPDLTLYHSGDTVLYPGLAEKLRDHRIDVALLPVNGRGKGVAGNMTFPEAVELCRSAGIPRLVPHHFGLFDFNTVDPADFTSAPDLEVLIPSTDYWLQLL